MRKIIFLMSVLAGIACKRQQDVPSQSISFEVLGDSIAAATQQALMMNVMKQMKENGPAHAIEFCNLKAVSLTDSMSRLFDCTIERVALKNRNPDNALSVEDEEVFKEYQQQWGSGLKAKSKVVEGKNETLFYKPIVLGMPQCLHCHGAKEL